MALSILRAGDVPRTRTAHLTRLTYEDGASSQEFHPPTAPYMMTQVLPPAKTLTFLAPPMHYHMYQTETFEVFSGRGRFVLNDTTIEKGVGETATIPVWTPHRFENADPEQPLVVGIKLDPRDWEGETRFFRNFFGYLDDCRKAKLEPSIFQLLRFLYAVDVPLAVPVPGPAVLKRWVSWAIMFVGGEVIGGCLLGYQRSYGGYYDEGEGKKGK